ncbi:hypothetical protein [Streptomyces zaomyceticus]|uniref:hypothetical protein n=1 Tax=Streptomyces zaomyceticus TaxID=68286 RepID=UPI002E1235C5|nr:hypothetical protein OG237_38675 [Streptomyces zaomyceticus]
MEYIPRARARAGSPRPSVSATAAKRCSTNRTNAISCGWWLPNGSQVGSSSNSPAALRRSSGIMRAAARPDTRSPAAAFSTRARQITALGGSGRAVTCASSSRASSRRFRSDTSTSAARQRAAAAFPWRPAAAYGSAA